MRGNRLVIKPERALGIGLGRRALEDTHRFEGIPWCQTTTKKSEKLAAHCFGREPRDKTKVPKTSVDLTGITTTLNKAACSPRGRRMLGSLWQTYHVSGTRT